MLRNLMGVDHIPVGVDSAGGSINAFSDVFAFDNVDGWASDPATVFSTGIVTDSEGTWLVNTAVGGSARGIIVPIGSVQDLTTQASYVGFRFKATSLLAGASGLMQITDGTNHANNYLLPGVVKPTMFSPALNTSYYIEVKFDRVANTITVRVNNVQVSSVAYTPSAITAAMWLLFGLTATGEPSNWSYQYKDFYFVDDTQDARTPNTWMGVQMLKPLSVHSASGSGYTATSGQATLLAALQSPVTATAGTQTTPVVTSPTPDTPLLCGMTGTILSTDVVNAVSFLVSAMGNSPIGQEIDPTIIDTASPPNVLAGRSIVLPDTVMHLARSAGAFPKAPDGTPWSLSSIESVEVSLLPKPLPNTVVLLHFDGTNGQTTTIDECGNPVTIGVGSQLSSVQSKFGGTALFCGTAGTPNTGTIAAKIPHTPSMAITGDMTIESFVFLSAVTNDTVLLEKDTIVPGVPAAAQRFFAELNKTTIAVKSIGTAAASSISGAVLTAGVWLHIAYVRHGGVWTAYLNGVAQTPTNATQTGDWSSTIGPLIIGNNYVGTSILPGYLDEFRLSRIARWTTNFTPPTTPYVLD